MLMVVMAAAGVEVLPVVVEVVMQRVLEFTV